MCVSGIGFLVPQSRYKEEHLKRDKFFGVKNHVFNKKSRISGIFKKSDLDFEDTKYRL